MPDKNCLSYWFPILQAAGLPVPRTEIVRTDLNLSCLLEGDQAPYGYTYFLAMLREAVRTIGKYPIFLRTGLGSGKHEWSRTCCIQKEGDIGNHVCALVEWSHLMGLSTSVWAVREMLPTMPLFTAFRGMPICREFRFFVDGGAVKCWHPYWPKAALEEGFPLVRSVRKGDVVFDVDRPTPPNWEATYANLCQVPPDFADVQQLAWRAGAVLGGQWSVDILETERGWYITDCTEAARSFHWPGCQQK